MRFDCCVLTAYASYTAATQYSSNMAALTIVNRTKNDVITYIDYSVIGYFFEPPYMRRCSLWHRIDRQTCMFDGVVRRLVGTIHVGVVQGAVTHAEHRFRTICASKHHRRVADYDQHADRCYVLRALCRSFHHAHPVL